jgi:hypothetical protein
LLEAILPSPSEPVSARELVEFKEKHATMLTRFRTTIESELLRIALIQDDEARMREKSLTEDRLREQTDGIVSAMHRRRWPAMVFGTIAGLVSVGAGAALAATTGGAALAFAAPGVVSGAYTAVAAFPRREVPDSPLAFAAAARGLG